MRAFKTACNFSAFQFGASDFKKFLSCSELPSELIIFGHLFTSHKSFTSENNSSKIRAELAPASSIDFKFMNASPGSSLKFLIQRSKVGLLPAPKIFSTFSSVIFPDEISCSKIESASRKAPSACLEISHNASFSKFTFSRLQISFNLLKISSAEML